MSRSKKIQFSVNLLLVYVFLFANFFFYISANQAFSAELSIQSELLIHDEEQSITGDLFDFTQISENVNELQVLKNYPTFLSIHSTISDLNFTQDLEIRIDSKFQTYPKRPECKIYLAVHSLKIP